MSCQLLIKQHIRVKSMPFCLCLDPVSDMWSGEEQGLGKLHLHKEHRAMIDDAICWNSLHCMTGLSNRLSTHQKLPCQSEMHNERIKPSRDQFQGHHSPKLL